MKTITKKLADKLNLKKIKANTYLYKDLITIRRSKEPNDKFCFYFFINIKTNDEDKNFRIEFLEEHYANKFSNLDYFHDWNLIKALDEIYEEAMKINN